MLKFFAEMFVSLFCVGLLPMRAVRLQLGVLLAADTTTLAAASANKVALIIAPFNAADETLVLSALTLATFTGSTPIAGVAGGQTVGNDPATGDQVITIKAPAGGWLFECSAPPTPPQVVYGYCLVDDTVATLLGTEPLVTATTITNVGDFIDLGKIDLTFIVRPIS